MATLAFQVIGTVIGTSLGGPIGAAIGKAAGGLAGALIDRTWMGGGARRVRVGPRLSDHDGITASEGAPVPRAYGRVRLGGQVIWATEFEESQVVERVGGSGGKSTGRQKSVRYVYYANVAIGLCEGEIAFVRRIWADGKLLDLAGLTYRVYTGTETQQPDPLIVAKQATGAVPAFRGLAYIVFERLPISNYGNRLPQFAFEIVRPTPGLPQRLKAINIIPGSTEFGYATSEVREDFGYGKSRALNRSQWVKDTDWEASIDDLQGLMPNLERATLISAWFGDDMRVGQCTLRPKVEVHGKLTTGLTWQVCGLERDTALTVSATEGRPNYGGSPTDRSIIQAIEDLKSRGLKVALHPFILMDIPANNGKPNPYTGLVPQPPFPWRGRITAALAPGLEGSSAGTPAVASEIAAFVGTAQPSHFTWDPVEQKMLYTGPAEWSFRRMVLHHAKLAAIAGGVDTFLIGSEMVGLTHLPAGGGAYPFVDALIDLLADVRAMLGPGTNITYAADWTEYSSHVQDGGQEVRFPLDPFWAEPDCAAVGIDLYLPVLDWRERRDHLDAAEATGPFDPAYLYRRLASGEAYDWYYASAEDRAAQIRSPIEDGAYGKPWIYRAKDFLNWWREPHIERVNGIELPAPTPWLPQSKPIWLTEIGGPAVNYGSNQPNVFPDPKSVESAIPHHSDGSRDDVAQRRLLEAILDRYDATSPGHIPAHNPVSPVYGGPMVEASFIAPWAYDARPFPAFPRLTSLWADGGNWWRGHWLNGRIETMPLRELIGMVLADHGQEPASLGHLPDGIEGYVIERPMSARAALEPLADAFGLVVRASAGGLDIEPRPDHAVAAVLRDRITLPGKAGQPEIDIRRTETVELPLSYRLGFIDGDRDFRKTVAEARQQATDARREVTDDSAMNLYAGQGEAIVERRLHDLWAARETFRFGLMPSQRALEPGDLITLETVSGPRLVMLTRISDELERVCEAVSFDPGYRLTLPPLPQAEEPPPPPPLPGKPFARVIELPVALAGTPRLLAAAVQADPWRGPYTIARVIGGDLAEPLADATLAARFGRLLTPLPPGPLWRWDKAAAPEIELSSGALASATEEAVLAGANRLAILNASGAIEIIGFCEASLIAPGRYRLGRLLRGLALSEPAAALPHGTGTPVLLLDTAVTELPVGVDAVGTTLDLAILTANRDMGDPTTVRLQANVAGLSLKPLAPVHARARREPSGVRIRFIRRARFGADGFDLHEVPLGEDREEYQLDVMAGATLKRRVNLTEPEFFYSEPDELADFGASQSNLSLVITQVSPVIGAGTSLTTTISIA